jgi:hypothetical protein
MGSMYVMRQLRNEDNLAPSRKVSNKEDHFVKHGVDDVLIRKKGVGSPSGPQSKQDLLTHVDICHRQALDLPRDE